MAITWYGNQSEAEGCHFGALAMLWPLLQRMQVASIIDRHLPADPQAEFSHGKVLSLLVAARLFSPVALVNVGGWAAESGADILWDIPVEKINDDRLGRSVDAYFVSVAEGTFFSFGRLRWLVFYGTAEFGMSSWAKRAV